MTAAVIVQLAQEGKLKFSDPVSKYVAGVPNGDHITIAELLEMRSGLYNYLNAPKISKSADHDPTRVWTPAELLAIAFAHPPNFPPGTDVRIQQYQLRTARPHRREGRRQDVGPGNAGPIVRAARHAAHCAASEQCERPPSPYSHGYLYGSSSVAFVGTPPYSAAVKAAATRRDLLSPTTTRA